MAEMKLTLTLSGVSNLTNSIGKLNAALRALNSILNRTAVGIEAVAQKMNNVASAGVPKVGSAVTGTGKGSKSKKNPSDESPQDAYSMLFSVFSGAPRNVGAKLATNYLRGLNLSTAALFRFATIAGLAYFGLSYFIKGIMMAVDELNYRVSNTYALLNATGGSNANSQSAKNIANALGLDSNKVANDIQNMPGGYREFMYKLEAIRNATGETKRLLANRFAMQDYQNADIFTNSEWSDLQKENKSTDKFRLLGEANTRLNLQWKSAMDTLSETFSTLVIVVKASVVTFVWLATRMLAFSNLLGELGAKVAMWLKNFFHVKLNDAADKLGSASKDLKDAAIGIKEGIYGGGERARGATPTAWGFNASMMLNNSRNLGAFEY